VAVADHIADHDVLAGRPAGPRAQIDPVAAAFGQRQPFDGDTRAAVELQHMAPFGVFIVLAVVIGAAHPQRGSGPDELDVLFAGGAEQGICRSVEGPFLGQHLGAGFKEQFLVAGQSQHVDDRGRRHLFHHDFFGPRVDRRLQRGGRFLRLKSPPGSLGHGPLPGPHFLDRLGIGRRAPRDVGGDGQGEG